VTEGIQGLGRLQGRVSKLMSDLKHVEAPLKAAGAYMVGSIEKNFRAQGRPQKWKKLAASTRGRRRRGRGRGRAQILIDTARLKNSIGYRLVSAGVEIGTNVRYAARQHFGYPKGTGRGHNSTPARPFVMVQTEDVKEVGEIFKRHVGRK
jgi:phage virion morphogenesis protein